MEPRHFDDDDIPASEIVNEEMLRELLPTINVALQEVWEAAGVRRARKAMAAAGNAGTATEDDGNTQGAKKPRGMVAESSQPTLLALPAHDAAMQPVEPECAVPYSHPLPLSG